MKTVVLCIKKGAGGRVVVVFVCVSIFQLSQLKPKQKKQ